MTELETQAILDKIAEAVKEANGDPKKEAVLIDALIDPADANACEGCQQFDIIKEWRGTAGRVSDITQPSQGNEMLHSLTIQMCRPVKPNNEEEEHEHEQRFNMDTKTTTNSQ